MLKIKRYVSEFGSISYCINDKRKVLIDASSLIDDKVEMIILTHCHFDHISHLRELKEKNRCEVCCGEGDREAIENADERTLAELFGKKMKGVKIDRTLKEGDIIDTGEYKLRVIGTPGHTPGSICLYDENNGVLFSGDVIFDKEGKSIGRTDLSGGDEEEIKKTLAKLKKLKINELFAGH